MTSSRDPESNNTDGYGAAVPDIGEVLDERYQLEAGAAHTSTGVVYPARRRGDGTLLSFVVASRLIDPKQRVRFVHDATVSQRLDGEHVLRVFDVGLLPNGVPFAVREPTISSLATEIRTRGPLPLAQAVAWTLEACEAIAEAHALDMAHGDLRPDNVYLARRERGEPLVKVEWMSAGKTSQATAEDPAKDLVALGGLLRVLATGQVDCDEAEGAPTLPCEVACTVARALATGNEPPFRDVAEFADALAPFAPSGHPSARNVAFLFARAGLLKVEAPQRPPQAPLPQRGPSNAPRGESLDDAWFDQKERAAHAPPVPVPSRTTTFAAVSLATVGTVLGSTVLLWATNHLPHWTGTAPGHEPAPVTLTSGETVHETSEVTLTAPPMATLRAAQQQQQDDDSPAAEAERARSVTKILPLPSVSDDEAELPSLRSITTTSKPAPEPPKPSLAPPTATVSAAETPPPLPVTTTTSTTASESAPAESEPADAAP